MMNRQLRRAQEKKDRQKEREKTRARQERRAKVVRRREKRQEKRQEPQSADEPKGRKTRAGRFAGAFTVATGVFIVLQALVPVAAEEGLSFSFIVEVLYYLLFGYFATTYLMRQGRARALEWAVGVGVALAVLMQGVAWAALGLPFDGLLLASAVPAVLVGAYLGRLVYRRAP